MKKPMQATFAESGFEAYRKPTRRELFLAEMERVVPWARLAALIDPVYPKPQGAGCRPIGLERMLRIYLLQHWFNLTAMMSTRMGYTSGLDIRCLLPRLEWERLAVDTAGFLK